MSTVVAPLIDLQLIANRIRMDIVKMIGAAGSGHPGGSLSAVELLVAPYFRVLHVVLTDILNPAQVDDKFRSVNWNVIEIDGHDLEQCIDALQQARSGLTSRLTAVVANTIKDKGVSFMENNPEWHCAAPNKEQVDA